MERKLRLISVEHSQVELGMENSWKKSVPIWWNLSQLSTFLRLGPSSSGKHALIVDVMDKSRLAFLHETLDGTQLLWTISNKSNINFLWDFTRAFEGVIGPGKLLKWLCE